MVRRIKKIKNVNLNNGQSKKGQPKKGSHAYKRLLKLKALEMMRQHNERMREFKAVKEAESAEEAARVASTEHKAKCHVCERCCVEGFTCQTCGLPVCDECCVPFTAQNKLTETMCVICGDRDE